MINKYITGIQHIGIPTKDVDSTVAFYQDLDFEIIYHNELVMDGQSKKVVFMKLNDLVFEFYEIDVTEKPQNQGVFNHLAINTTNVETLFALFCKHPGYKVLDEAIVSLPLMEKGVRFFRIMGPNSEVIEFNEIM